MTALLQSLQRIQALLLRQMYLLLGSVPRLVDIIYWPTMQMVLWGFIGRYLGDVDRLSAGEYMLGAFLGATLLWDVVFRVQIGISLAYMEDIWSRNVGHLFISPMRPWEWWVSMVLYGLCRVVIGLTPAILLAIPFYGFSLFDIGWPLLFFALNLGLMACWMGFLANAILLRAGIGAEYLIWAMNFMLAPFAAIYYPVTVLPEWLQPLSLAIPATHVFEALREVLGGGALAMDGMLRALGLNLLYGVIALTVLQAAFNGARTRGTLFQTGE